MSQWIRHSGAWLMLLNLSATASEAQVRVTQVIDEKPGEPVTWQDIFRVTDLGAIAVSPDGTRVAFVMRQADEACNCYRHELWVYSWAAHSAQTVADLGQPFVAMYPGGIVHGSPVTPAPRWSEDGRYLAFLRHEADRPVLYVFDFEHRATHALYTDGDPVYGFTWSGEPGTLLYQTGTPRPQVVQSFEHGLREGFLYGPDFENADAGSLPLVPKIPVIFGDGSLFGGDRDAIEVIKRTSRAGESSLATESDLGWWRNAGRSSAVGPHRAPSLVRGRSTRNAVVLKSPYPGSRDVQVTLRFSPSDDAQTVACGDLCEAYAQGAYWDEAEKAFVVLRDGWHLGAAPERRLHFSRIDVRKHAETELFEMGIAEDHMSVMEPKCDLNGARLVCVEERIDGPPRLVWLNREGSRTVLFDPNAALRERHFNRIEKLEWLNAAGGKAYGYLVYPRGYHETQRYPLVIVQYSAEGFGRGGTGNENPIHSYAEAGFFVLVFSHPPDPPTYVEPEGADKEKWAAQFRARHAWVQDSLDRVLGHLIDVGRVDVSRIAYTGLSGGANLIDYSLAQGRKIAVVITSTCCIGPELVYLQPLLLWKDGYHESMGFGNPLDDPEYLEKWRHQSPSLHVESIESAILANMSQGEMLASLPLLARMRAQHRPMELYVYAGERHIKNQPAHRAAIFRRNIDWLRFWLQNYEDPAQEKAEQNARWRALRGARATQ